MSVIAKHKLNSRWLLQILSHTFLKAVEIAVRSQLTERDVEPELNPNAIIAVFCLNVIDVPRIPFSIIMLVQYPREPQFTLTTRCQNLTLALWICHMESVH